MAAWALHDDGSIVAFVAGDAEELEPARALGDGWLEHEDDLSRCHSYHGPDVPIDVDETGWCRTCGAVVGKAA